MRPSYKFWCFTLKPLKPCNSETSHQGEALSQIHAADFGVAAQFLRGSGAEDATLIDDVRTIRDRECFAHIVVGDQDSDAAGLEIENYFLQVQNSDGVDPRE